MKLAKSPRGFFALGLDLRRLPLVVVQQGILDPDSYLAPPVHRYQSWHLPEVPLLMSVRRGTHGLEWRPRE